MVGWNIEIMFMFAISGIIYYNTLSEDRSEKILGLPNQFYVAIILVINMKTIKRKIMAVSSLYAIALIANIVAMGVLGWHY